MSMLPPSTKFPGSFRNPVYELLARAAEQRTGLPRGILDAIRTRGEMSNADQVSEAGAKTPYQFIPATRQGMIKNYGVDPWRDPEAATQAAALLLKENFGRTKSWDAAIAQYHGGTDVRNWGPRTRSYVQRVGSFDNKEQDMPQRPAYPVIEIPDSYDPRYPSYRVDGTPGSYDPRYLPTNVPERPSEPAPIQGLPSMSVSQPSTSVPPDKKKRGLLGSIGHVLGQVFAPDPTTLYGAAMNNPNGIWGARGAQQAYRQAQEKGDLDTALTRAKLQNFLTKGEYQIAGNNVIHFPPGGGEPEIITPPATQSEKERLIDRWSKMDDTDPAKQLIEDMLRGSNAEPVLENRENVARIRAGATTNSARIRANAPSKTSTKPPAGFILDN